MGVKQNLPVALTCISLTASDVEHFLYGNWAFAYLWRNVRFSHLPVFELGCSVDVELWEACALGTLGACPVCSLEAFDPVRSPLTVVIVFFTQSFKVFIRLPRL